MSESGYDDRVQEAEPLFCPNCDYNVTGLTRDLCPECGKAFDPSALRKAQQGIPRPIGMGELVKRICLPMPFGFYVLLFAKENSILNLLLIPVIVVVPFWCGVTAYSCAERLAVNLAIKRRRPRQEWSDYMGVVWVAAAILLCVEFMGTALVAAACVSFVVKRGGFN